VDGPWEDFLKISKNQGVKKLKSKNQGINFLKNQ
jgi:hypothetical protein